MHLSSGGDDEAFHADLVHNRSCKDANSLCLAEEKPFFVKSLKLCGNAVKRKMDACATGQNALHYQYKSLMGAFAKKRLVIKEPRRNGKNDLEQV